METLTNKVEDSSHWANNEAVRQKTATEELSTRQKEIERLTIEDMAKRKRMQEEEKTRQKLTEESVRWIAEDLYRLKVRHGEVERWANGETAKLKNSMSSAPPPPPMSFAVQQTPSSLYGTP